jgi:hypothetical protein
MANGASNSGTEKKRNERDFLHDLATPVSVALGQLDAALDDGRVNGNLTENQKTRMEKAMKALSKIRDLMTDRRNEINSTEKNRL